MPSASSRLLMRFCLVCSAGLAPSAMADEFRLPSPGSDVVGQISVALAAHADTLADIARRFNIGHQEIRIANPSVDFWLPGEGTRVTIPGAYILPDARRQGIVLNVPEMRLYYFPEPGKKGGDAGVVVTYPVSIGRMDWSTPLGRTRVTAKVRNPSWTPPASIHREHAARGEPLPKVVPPGPDNPLGDYALRLDIPGYLIHGTNRPYGVGMRVTHGCVRMYPEDIEDLFSFIPVGIAVEIVDQPIKLGWLRDTLYIEVHPLLDEDARNADELRQMALELIAKTETVRPLLLSGRRLQKALDEQSGLPVPIAESP